MENLGTLKAVVRRRGRSRSSPYPPAEFSGLRPSDPSTASVADAAASTTVVLPCASVSSGTLAHHVALDARRPIATYSADPRVISGGRRRRSDKLSASPRACLPGIGLSRGNSCIQSANLTASSGDTASLLRPGAEFYSPAAAPLRGCPRVLAPTNLSAGTDAICSAGPHSSTVTVPLWSSTFSSNNHGNTLPTSLRTFHGPAVEVLSSCPATSSQNCQTTQPPMASRLVQVSATDIPESQDLHPDDNAFPPEFLWQSGLQDPPFAEASASGSASSVASASDFDFPGSCISRSKPLSYLSENYPQFFSTRSSSTGPTSELAALLGVKQPQQTATLPEPSDLATYLNINHLILLTRRTLARQPCPDGWYRRYARLTRPWILPSLSLHLGLMISGRLAPRWPPLITYLWRRFWMQRTGELSLHFQASTSVILPDFVRMGPEASLIRPCTLPSLSHHLRHMKLQRRSIAGRNSCRMFYRTTQCHGDGLWLRALPVSSPRAYETYGLHGSVS